MKRALSWTLATCAALAIAFTFVPFSSATDAPPAPAPQLDDDDGDEADAPTPAPCVRTEFKTALAKKACTEGGQKAAKRAMKTFTKAAKAASGEKITCKSCHTKLSPEYPLKEDAVSKFEAYEKLIAAKKGAAVNPAQDAEVIRAHLAR